MNNKLRIGILLENDNIPAWSYKMLQEIVKSKSSEIVLIVKNKDQKGGDKRLFKKILNNRRRMFFSLFTKIESKLFKASNNAFALKNISTLLAVDTLEVQPTKTKFRDIISNKDILEIKKYKIDVFIRMGFRILSGDILKVARFGVWSYHHGDNKINRGSPAGFWEVLENWPETGVTLQILTENLDAGFILKKSYSSTNNYSFTRNKNKYYWKALSFLPDKLNELYTLGDVEFFNKVNKLNDTPQFYSNRLYTAPSNKEMLILSTKLIKKIILNKIYSLFYFDQWILLYRLSKDNELSTSFYKFNKIIPPKDRFWADPHIIRRDGKYYIFIEELIYKANKGHISVIIMDDNGSYSQPTIVLEKDYHLSYPFLIEDHDSLYMIPETKENNKIELYKCISFPDKWELEKVLIDDISAVDATVTYKDGKYWMFANAVRNTGGSSLDELFLFSSDKLASDNWVAHPQNPIISDVKQARPAGKLFEYGGKTYRPSQNCAKRYGYGIKINEVTELNEANYSEKTVDSIYPNWDKSLKATHTINFEKKLTVIDAQMKRLKCF